MRKNANGFLTVSEFWMDIFTRNEAYQKEIAEQRRLEEKRKGLWHWWVGDDYD